MSQFNTIEEVINAISRGKIIIVVDDEDRENEGDFICAAETVTPEIINFMAKYGRGLICTPLTEEKCKRLDLNMMVPSNTDPLNTAFTVSVDLKDNGVTTGISASDRANTIRALTNESAVSSDFTRPGHVFPLIAKRGGVLRRTGHTEAAIDLARLAGLYPAGVVVEIMNEDGSMARLPKLFEIANKHNLNIISIEQLIAYRLKNDSLIEKINAFEIPSVYGEYRVHLYKQTTNNQIHIALTKGDWKKNDAVITRIESIRFDNMIYSLLQQKPSHFIEKSLNFFKNEQICVIVLINKKLDETLIINNQLLDNNLNKESDTKDFGIGAQILNDLNIYNLKLLSNSKTKRIGLQGYGISIKKYVSY